jgi:hypothetical protein
MTIADLKIVTGGASAPPAIRPHPMSRTITDGVPAVLEGGHAKAP